jgi:AcrR family transcriptional regulator
MPGSRSASPAKARKTPSSTKRVITHPDVNQQGQALGPKGQQTRQRLIEAVEHLLRTKRLRDLRQADVCRVAKVAPSSFYSYFPDMEALVLEAIAVNQTMPSDMQALLEEDWPPELAFSKARTFVGRYIEYWEEHFHLFKARNLAADEGDPAVHELRLSMQEPVRQHLAEKIQAGQRYTRTKYVDPEAGAAVVMASLERLMSAMSFSSVRSDDLIDIEAWILTRMMGLTDNRQSSRQAKKVSASSRLNAVSSAPKRK